MARRKPTYRKKRQNRLGMFLVMTVVLMLLLVVTNKSVELKAKQSTYQQEMQVLQDQIALEKTRSEEIAEFEKYTKTKKYIEEIAKDKLGLVKDGEIIFKSID
ncbi:MAG TPA: septum formation initiator family protein [Lachnospiraceae bacterium]|nr:septum formation initiator family protein [Lachnospiraceae bacterium]